MQDLRLIGVHEDGAHLILGDTEGNRYRVAIDEPLRVAARRDRPRLGQLQIEIDGGMRPREVQALIRAGLSADEVADRAGWSAEKVRRYEGPILAERAHVADQARQVRLRPRGGHGVSGSSPTLGHRVAERFHAREIDPGTLTWDSHKIDAQTWAVVLGFVAGGQQRHATWDYELSTGTLLARDDEARWISEDESAPESPVAAPHLRDDRPTTVYDVEAEGGVAAPRRRRGGEPIDLTRAMRERSAQRGRRRKKGTDAAAHAPGLESAPDEALPLEDLAMPLDQAGLPPGGSGRSDDAADESMDQAAAEVSDGETSGEGTQQPDAAVARHEEPDLPFDEPLPEPVGVTVVEAVQVIELPADGDGKDDEGPDAEPDAPPVAVIEVVEVVQVVAVSDADTVTDGEGTTDGDEPREVAERDATGEQDEPGGIEQDGTGEQDEPSGIEQDGTGKKAERTEQAEEPRQQEREPAPAPRPKAPPRRSGRPSVPSWDDIMFGRKND